jgi:capsule polysaccharide export protein KpsE/RkpR
MRSQIDLSFLVQRAALKRMALVALAFALAGVAYALLAPRWYRTTVTVVPAKAQGGGGLANLLASDGAAGLAGFLDASGGTDVSRIAAVLQSMDVSDAVIEKFDLKTRYREKYQELARDALWEHCDVRVQPKPGLVQLACEDKDPRFAQQMVAFFAEYGNQVFRRISVSSASEEVRFLEKRVGEIRKQAGETATRMREFQEKYRIVDLESQAKAVVSTLAALNSQTINRQLELEYARTFSSQDEPSLQQMESQLSIMGRKVHSLEEPLAGDESAGEPGRGRAKANRGMFPPALEVPRLRAEFEGLYRDRKVAEATLIFTLERLESAKANEARDVSTFLVLDPPTLPTRKYRPKGAGVVLLLTIVGALAGVAYEAWRSGHLAASGLAREPGESPRIVEPRAS